MDDFQKLYEDYYQVIYKFLLKITNFNLDLADELTQETFFQVYISLHKYKGNSSIVTWMCSIAKNVCYKYYKKHPIMLDITEAKEVKSISLEEAIERKELFNKIIKEIVELKKKYKDVLTYRLFFDMPFSEIALLIGISESSAKVIFHRGKNMVKDKLEGFYNE